MNFLLPKLNSLGFHVGLPRPHNFGRDSFCAKAIKLQFAKSFMRGDSKKLVKAKLVILEARTLAKEYGRNEPLEIPEVKRLMELFPNE